MRLSLAPFTMLLSTLAAFGTSAIAAAVVAPPPNSTVPAFISLVGQDGLGHPDPAGAFTITVRDLANNPQPGVTVVVDVGDSPGFLLAAQQMPGVTTACVAGKARALATTDAQGIAHFNLIGAALATAVPTQRVAIYANGVSFGRVPLSAYDLVGANGVNGTDLAAWAADFLSATNPMRSDFNGDGVVSGADLALWTQLYIRAHSTKGAAALGDPCTIGGTPDR